MKKSVLFLVLPLMAILLGVSSCKKDDKGSTGFSASFSENSNKCIVTVRASESTFWQTAAVNENIIKNAELDPYKNKKEICEWIAQQAPKFFKGNNSISFYKNEMTPNLKYYFYTFSINNIDEAKVTEIAEIFEYTLTTNN